MAANITMTEPTLAQVRAAVALAPFDSRAAQARMAPSERPFGAQNDQVRRAAVLLLLYPESDNQQLAFPLIRRAEYPGVHSGQMSLPGGRLEVNESWEQAALRETCEEIGVCGGIELIGSLALLYVPPSNFEIYPVVGLLSQRPDWKIDTHEVAQVHPVGLSTLLDESSKCYDEREFVPGRRSRLPHYVLADQIVWGATAIILSEFEQRLRAVIA
jgi:8-oxo-dGTP pyrophosphatase MutT (NUDIX family)